MSEKSILLALAILYLGSFLTRYLLVKKRTGKIIRARDPLVTASIVFSTMCAVVCILSACFSVDGHYRPFDLPNALTTGRDRSPTSSTHLRR